MKQITAKVTHVHLDLIIYEAPDFMVNIWYKHKYQ